MAHQSLKRMPTEEEFLAVVNFMQNSWIYISDDDMYEFTEEDDPEEVAQFEELMTDILGEPFTVSR